MRWLPFLAPPALPPSRAIKPQDHSSHPGSLLGEEAQCSAIAVSAARWSSDSPRPVNCAGAALVTEIGAHDGSSEIVSTILGKSGRY